MYRVAYCVNPFAPRKSEGGNKKVNTKLYNLFFSKMTTKQKIHTKSKKNTHTHFLIFLKEKRKTKKVT